MSQQQNNGETSKDRKSNGEKSTSMASRTAGEITPLGKIYSKLSPEEVKKLDEILIRPKKLKNFFAEIPVLGRVGGSDWSKAHQIAHAKPKVDGSSKKS